MACLLALYINVTTCILEQAIDKASSTTYTERRKIKREGTAWRCVHIHRQQKPCSSWLSSVYKQSHTLIIWEYFQDDYSIHKAWAWGLAITTGFFNPNWCGDRSKRTYLFLKAYYTSQKDKEKKIRKKSVFFAKCLQMGARLFSCGQEFHSISVIEGWPSCVLDLPWGHVTLAVQ